LKFNKSLLINLFYLIGKEEDNTQTQLLVRLLLVMMSKDSYLVSPLSWENLFSIIEEEIVTGNNTSETFRAFSKIFYLLPSNGVKRLFGDFFDYMKTLLESFLEDPLSMLPSLFHDIISFLISTKLNIAFQKKLVNDEVHFVLYKILKSLFKLEKADDALLFIEENRKLLIQIIINCLSVVDTHQQENFIYELLFNPPPYQIDKFENEILGPLLYTNSVTNIIPLIVNFKSENIHFEDFVEKPAIKKIFKEKEPAYFNDNLLKLSVNTSSALDTFYWKKINDKGLQPVMPVDLVEVDHVLIEINFIFNDAPVKFIALINSGFNQVGSQIKTKETNGNFLFKYENQKLNLLTNEVNLLILDFNPGSFQLKIFCQHVKILEMNKEKLKANKIAFESSVLKKEDLEHLKKDETTYLNVNCSREIWTTFNIIDTNRFEKSMFSQLKPFFSQKKNSLFLLPSKLTLEEFLLILFSHHPEHISSLRVSLNEEKVGMHTKIEDLILKEKSNYIEIAIKSIDDVVGQIPLLSPEEVLKTALTKLSYKPWTLISRCSSFLSQENIFQSLSQIISNVCGDTKVLSLRYKTLVQDFAFLSGPLKALFGVQLYNLFFWFLFDHRLIEQKLNIFWRTILYAIMEKNLSKILPNEIEILIDTYMKSNVGIINDRHLESKRILKNFYKFVVIQDKYFINLFVEGIVWKRGVLFENNVVLNENLKEI